MLFCLCVKRDFTAEFCPGSLADILFFADLAMSCCGGKSLGAATLLGGPGSSLLAVGLSV